MGRGSRGPPCRASHAAPSAGGCHVMRLPAAAAGSSAMQEGSGQGKVRPAQMQRKLCFARTNQREQTCPELSFDISGRVGGAGGRPPVRGRLGLATRWSGFYLEELSRYRSEGGAERTQFLCSDRTHPYPNKRRIKIHHQQPRRRSFLTAREAASTGRRQSGEPLHCRSSGVERSVLLLW